MTRAKFSLASGSLVLLVSLASLLAGPGLGCRGRDAKPGAADAAAVVEAPVAAPEGLLGEIYFPAPDVTWKRLQANGGGAISLLPPTFGGLLCSLANLDSGVAREVDGQSPAYGLAVRANAEDPRLVVVAKLLDARRFMSTLVDGETSRFRSTPDPTVGMGALRIEPKREGGLRAAGGDMAVAVLPSGYLIVASRPSDLSRWGPYAYRTLPTLPLPKASLTVDIPKTALRGALKDMIEARWASLVQGLTARAQAERDKRGGRNPDFADPAPILEMLQGFHDQAMNLVSDIESVRAGFDVSDERLAVEFSARPSSATGLAYAMAHSLPSGDTAPLTSLPSTVVVAALVSVSTDPGSSKAQAFEDGLQNAFGKRLPPPDRAKLHAAVFAVAKAAGPYAALGLSIGPSVAGRIATPDPTAMTTAIRESARVLRLPAFRGPLLALFQLRDVSIAKDNTDKALPPGAGVVTFGRGLPPGVPPGIAEPPPLHMVVVPESSSVSLLIAGGSDSDLAAMVQSARAPTVSLGDDAKVRSALAHLPGKPAVTFLVQPARAGLGSKGAGSGGPVVLAWGRKDDGASALGDALWLEVEGDYGFLGEVTYRLLGF